MTKLLYVANARIPTEKAHGIQIMKMCEAFVRCGAEVELVVPHRRNPITTDPFDYYGVPRTFTLTKLFSLDAVRFAAFGFWVQRLSFLSSALPYAVKARADVVYSRDIYFCFALSLMRVRGVIFEDHEPLRNKRLYAFLLRRIPRKILVAAHLQGLYRSLGVSLAGTCIAPNGVDLEEFNATSPDRLLWEREYGIKHGKKIILYTGHFYRWKGMYTLLESSRFIGNSAVVVCVGGTTDDYAEALRFVTEQKLSHVRLVPFLPHAEIVRHLKSADVLALPNTAAEERSLRYTTPLKLFEYMASGVPIVASRIPSFAPYLLDGKNAILCNPDDPEDLTFGIQKVLADISSASNYANAAHQLVANHTWMKRAKSILSSFVD